MSVWERESASFYLYSRSEKTCDTSSRFLISLFAFYSYISSYSSLIITSTVISILCDHRVRILQQCLVDAEG